MGGDNFKSRRVLVVGLARSGLAAAEFLAKRGARVKATDMKSEGELSEELSGLEQKGVELVLGSHPPGLVEDVELVIVSPGVPSMAPPLNEARAKGIPVWGNWSLVLKIFE